MPNVPPKLTCSQLIRNAKAAEDKGDFVEARKLLETAVAEAEKLGATSGFLQESHEAMSGYLIRHGLDEHAIKHLQKLLDLGRRRWGSGDIRLLSYLDQLADRYKRLEQPRPLEPVLREALKIDQEKGAPTEKVIKRLEALADVLNVLRKNDEAFAFLKQARELKQQSQPAAPPEEPAAAPSAAPLVIGSKVLLGQLLMRSGLFKYEQLNKHLQVAKMLELPLGQVLTSSGEMTQEHVNIALELQSLARSNQLTFEQAAVALATVVNNNLTLPEVLNNMQCGPRSSGDKLGDLLLDAGIVSAENLQKVLAKCVESRTPVGKQLVLDGLVGANIVAEALTLQERVRAGTLDRRQAVIELKAAAGIK